MVELVHGVYQSRVKMQFRQAGQNESIPEVYGRSS